jgi:hypothetical protein
MEEVEAIRLLNRPMESFAWKHLGQVEKRAGDASNCDRVAPGPVVVIETTDVVERDARPSPAAASGHRDVNRGACGWTKLPERRGTPVAEHRVRPAGEDRGQPATVRRERRVTDGLDADMNRLEPSRRNPVPDRPPREPKLEELPMVNDAMLTGSQRRDRSVTWSTSNTYVMFNVDQVRHAAHSDGEIRTEQRTNVTRLRPKPKHGADRRPGRPAHERAARAAARGQAAPAARGRRG